MGYLAYIEALVVSQCKQRSSVGWKFLNGRPQRFGCFIAVLVFVRFTLGLLRKLVIKSILQPLFTQPIGAFIIGDSKGPSRKDRYIFEFSYAFYYAIPGFLNDVPCGRFRAGYLEGIMPEPLLPSVDKLVERVSVTFLAFNNKQLIVDLCPALSHGSIIEVG